MRERCDIKGHGPTCEGGSLHIRARDAKGCAQLQDGSWITKNYSVCPGPHRRGKAPAYGEGEAIQDWLDAEFARLR